MSNVRTFATLAAAKAAYPAYVLFDEAGSQYYKPSNGMEPWDCPCVAIWTLDAGRIATEEY